jgi:type II secretory pathway pseudopilin PulG
MSRAACAQSPAWSRSRCAPAAFTIVELLVIAALIAVLIALLAPALGRARDQARLALCRSHLRNTCLSTLMYANANASALPVDEKLDNPHLGLIAALRVGRYQEDARNYYCPSQTQPDLRYSEENLAAGNISYFYFSCERVTKNRDVSTFLRWSVKWPRRLNDTMDPATWVLSDCWFSGQPTAHWYFRRGVNYVTLNGTVRMVQRGPRSAFK